MDQTTAPVLHTCAVSGEQSPGKHYLLPTTEGTETVCPESLFHNGADRRMAVMLVDLQHRVAALEKRLGEQDQDQEQAEPRAARKVAARKTSKAGE